MKKLKKLVLRFCEPLVRKEFDQAQIDLINMLASVVELRMTGASYHTTRVSEFAYMLSKIYGLEEEQCILIQKGAILHDIGKASIPDHLLLKEGPLTKEEFEIVKTHSLTGEKFLSRYALNRRNNFSLNVNTEVIRVAGVIAGSHHEKYDGTGYPRQLAGKDIPLEGRITAICDVFDALTSSRCYKSKWKDSTAYEFMKNNAGSHFDPTLIRIFLKRKKQITKVQETYVDHKGPKHEPNEV